jgi:hypothetical protein
VNRRDARANRIGLAVIGIALCAVGGGALAVGLGAFGPDTAALPLLDGGVAGFARDRAWFWPGVAAAGILLAVAGLGWLVARLRGDRLRRLRLESGASGVTELGGGAAGEALAVQVEGYPGVRRAHATLRGSPAAPRLDLRVRLRETASLAALVVLLREEALRDLSGALGRERVPTLVRLGFARDETDREIQ